ncbi:cupin domain-containing protein [Alkaliphilus sp. B6464]|uniref:cupin domain-containing protein n=1 Tax=Alkaliphilus sp. B6464 TaxID=2731219 RepID=UPI001BA7C710|nr:cupin domain-containing protein [Alkaliphilus sp. B6464]QUH18638.1 cupin domain-containing protein [Alkaliphilus sp. B6464]
MYNVYNPYPYPYFINNTPMYTLDNMYSVYNTYSCPYYLNAPMYNTEFSKQFSNQYPYIVDEFGFLQPINDDALIELRDYGPEPFVVNIEKATKQNNTFRTALWTGNHLQVTLMSINIGEDIGLEVHPTVDQFIRIEEGQGLIKMGDSKCNLDFQRKVCDDFAIMIPAGKWHNLINTGNKPLKLYSIYAPPAHPHGTVHQTKEDAEREHGH